MSERGRPRVVGILCTYRRPWLAAAYLDRLAEQSTPPDLTVLIDNGSDPELRALCVARSTDAMTIRYVDPGRNIGPAGAFHLGVWELAAEVDADDVIVHLDDNDPPVRADELERLVDRLTAETAEDGTVAGIGVSGGRLSRWTGTVRGPAGSGPVDEVDHLHGWGLPVYRAWALRSVGGNDPSYFYGFEELELGRRLRASGQRLLVDSALMAELLPSYPRRNADPRPRLHIADTEADPAWSRFHKERNLIRVLRRENLWIAIAVTFLTRHLAKPILSAPRQPAAAGRRILLGVRATRAGLRDAGGIDARYPPPGCDPVGRDARPTTGPPGLMTGRDRGGSTDPPIELSVLIAARNAAATIGEQLQALSEQSWSGSWEIVIADNGSTDTTADIVRRFQETNSRISLLDASAVTGAASARNAAMSAARGESFAFCDADDVVEPGWVAAMGTALRDHELVAGPVSVDRLNPPWLRTAFYQQQPRRLETFAGIFPFAATCNLGVRRTVIDQVGGFDPLLVNGEDTELCLRMWAAGIELVYLPEAVVQYRYRADLRSLWSNSRQYGTVGPTLAPRLAAMGAPTPPHWAGLRQWLWLVRKVHILRTRQGRARWLVVAGGKVGRVQGSWRSRWLYL